jgi:hypothetical protein
MDSLGNVFHKLGIEWTHYLARCEVAFSELGVHRCNWYTYPDRHFGLFLPLPFNQSIITIIGANVSNCTLTIQWLIQTYPD